MGYAKSGRSGFNESNYEVTRFLTRLTLQKKILLFLYISKFKMYPILSNEYNPFELNVYIYPIHLEFLISLFLTQP